MLGHSLEHIALRHGTRLAARAQAASGGTIPLIFMGAWSGTCSEPALIPNDLLATERNNELEADAFAVETVAHAGFDPTALARYIARVQPQTLRNSSMFPSRDDRVAAIQAVIGRLPEPASDYQVTGSQFDSMQRRLSRAPAGAIVDAAAAPGPRRARAPR